MSLEDNKRVALSFVRELGTGDLKAIDALLDDEASFWIIGDLPFSGTHRKPAYMGLIESLMETLDGGIAIEVGDVTAEEDRVSVTGTGTARTKGGSPYDNVYHFLFYVRNGKIAGSREYVDTHLIYGLADVADRPPQ